MKCGTHLGDSALVEPFAYEKDCPGRQVLDRIGDAWSVLIVCSLAGGELRYTELAQRIPAVSPKMLTQTLRGLERDGLVTRTVHPEVPVRVEYSLAPLGWSITRLLMTMYEWSAEHAPQTRRQQLRLAA